MGTSWHLMRVPRPKHVGQTARYEFTLSEFLERAGFRVYVPFRTVFRFKNKADKAKRKEKEKQAFPLLVGYLFIEIRDYQWRELIRRGLLKFLMGNKRSLYTFSPEWMDRHVSKYGPHYTTDWADDTDGTGLSLTQFSEPEYFAHIETFAEYAVGDKATFREGTLTGFEVEVREIMDHEAKIAFELFGIEQEQLVHLSQLIKA